MPKDGSHLLRPTIYKLGDTWELLQQPPWWPQQCKCLCPLVPTWRRTDPCSSLVSPLNTMGSYVKAGRFAKWERLTGAYETKAPSQIAIRRELLLRVVSAPAFPRLSCLLDAVVFVSKDACLNLPQMSCPQWDRFNLSCSLLVAVTLFFLSV